MEHSDWRYLLKQRTLALATMALGLIVLLSPIFLGEWIIALLGVLLVGAGLFQFVEVFRFNDETISFSSYFSGVASILFGLLLFLSPSLVLSGVVVGLTICFLVDGGIKIRDARRQTGPDRRWGLFNAFASFVLALLIWYLLNAKVGIAAIGIVLGLRLLVEGWTRLLLPRKALEAPSLGPDAAAHVDQRLGLPPSEAVREMYDSLSQTDVIITGRNISWCLTFLAVFFAIHVLRTDTQWSLIGFISPFSASVGDAIVALLLAIVLILPTRMFWRKITRPIERAAWRHFQSLKEAGAQLTLGERALRRWLVARMRFSMETREMRSSLNFAFWRVLRIGLPLTAILISINSIWGFSWYFNSENWASAVWQEITKDRVDTWRSRMAEAIEMDASARGLTAENVFRIVPEGVDESSDFSFVLIGDTGEGDPSQMSLRDQLIASGNRGDVKFLLLSSDVIYPDGKMRDYETNFYLPFKGFAKPIYAIPGNHDWFDAIEGFNANFLDRDSAILAMRARLLADTRTEMINTDQRFREMTDESDRLRKYYGIRNGLQRAPFFDMHTTGFSLIAVDTGILRRLDPREKAWFEAALGRAGNNFVMVVLGHPFYVAGEDSASNDQTFAELHEIMRRHGVDIAAAGDTHDFEFYRERYEVDSKPAEMLHFVNGGGGAYLSIGTAMAFPEQPVSSDYVFYPRTDELKAKMRREAPFWKVPLLTWMDWIDGYPLTAETLSGAFDFNRAPFFQSFLEVKVERSQKRVRLLLYGVNGQLRWRDIQIGGQVKPAERSEDDFVEFIAPMQ